MEFRILGPLEVLDGDRQVRVGGIRECALLAMLLIHAGEVVSVDRLIDGLWGSELPANPANALQVVVSRVRRALEPSPLVTRKPGYLLEIGPDELDAHRFGCLVTEAKQLAATDLARRSALLDEALRLWRGPVLAEFAREHFAREEIARLEEARLQAVEMKTEAELALGRHADLVPQLKALVSGNQLRERLRGQLMLALYRSGRQGEALRVFQEGRAARVDELGVDPGPELQELHQQILLQAPSLAAVPESVAAPAGNLPAQVTSFVGRHTELQDTTKLLGTSRLVTLTGAGGCGKTRLALETAHTLLGSFPDGVWLVELESVTDPALVPHALAAPFGIRDGSSLGMGPENPKPLAEKLVDYLRGKDLLLVLDTCEHLVGACAQIVGNVLRTAPKVRFLTTSREHLDVAGEALLPVPPLSTPGVHDVSPEQLDRSDAARLFADRATAVQPAFVLDAASSPAVSLICRRLDGIPLAIELAAARVRMLPPQEIAARLDDRLGILTSGNRSTLPRHRTVQAAIDWSYRLLSEPEQELFARLSVFTGGFTLEAAEQVCANTPLQSSSVLELVSRLVDQSLLVPGMSRQARFRMLETLRAYAAARLAESGATASLQRRHAQYFLGFAEQAELHVRGPRQGEWLRRLGLDHDNLTAAIDWASSNEPEVAVRISSALAHYWLIGRHRSEVRQRLTQAVDAAQRVSPAVRVKALAWAAQLANVEGSLDRSAPLAREAYELSKNIDDRWVAALAEMILGLTTGLGGDIEQAFDHLDAARTTFDEAGDAWGAAMSTMLLGYASTFAAQHARAETLTRRSLDGFRTAGDLWGQTMALELLGLLARNRGAYQDAIAAYEEALGVIRDLGLRDEIPFLLVDLGDLQVLREGFEAATILHKQALDAATELGAPDATALARSGLARAARRQGRYDQARELFQRALFFYREAGFPAETANTLAALGFVEELDGNLDAAEAYHHEGLRLARNLADQPPSALALEGLACVAAARQESERAAILLGAADSIRTRAGSPLPPQERADVGRATDAALSALGRDAFTAAVEQGRGMTIRQLIDGDCGH